MAPTRKPTRRPVAKKTAAKKTTSSRTSAAGRQATKTPAARRTATRKPPASRPKPGPKPSAAKAPGAAKSSVPKTGEKAARPAPSSKPLGQRMFLRPGMEAVVLGAPGDAATLLGALPAGARVRTKLGTGAPFILAFVRNRTELEQRMAEIGPTLTPTTLLWVAYPKQSSKVETDLNRDRGWESVERLGLRGIAQVAVDPTWAATRFRPSGG